jgi:hypothetical protein
MASPISHVLLLLLLRPVLGSAGWRFSGDVR